MNDFTYETAPVKKPSWWRCPLAVVAFLVIDYSVPVVFYFLYGYTIFNAPPIYDLQRLQGIMLYLAAPFAVTWLCGRLIEGRKLGTGAVPVILGQVELLSGTLFAISGDLLGAVIVIEHLVLLVWALVRYDLRVTKTAEQESGNLKPTLLRMSRPLSSSDEDE